MSGTAARLALAASLGAAAAGTLTAQAAPRSGAAAARRYSATAGSGLGQSFFALRVSRDGRAVTVVPEQLGFACRGGQDRGAVIGLSTADGHGGLAPDGSFSVAMTVVSDSPGQTVHDTPVLIAGRFSAGGRATGTMSFQGSDGEDTGCDASVRWSARIDPLRLHFAGRTDAGVSVRFDRTLAAAPEVLNFSVGGIRARCAAGGSEVKDVRGAFGGRIRHGRFSSDGEDALSEAVAVSGRFLSRRRAVGLVSLTGRDDCGYRGVRWSARVVGRGV